MVERWAWFGVFTGEAMTNANGLEAAEGSANAVGLVYVTL